MSKSGLIAWQHEETGTICELVPGKSPGRRYSRIPGLWCEPTQEEIEEKMSLMIDPATGKRSPGDCIECDLPMFVELSPGIGQVLRCENGHEIVPLKPNQAIPS